MVSRFVDCIFSLLLFLIKVVYVGLDLDRHIDQWFSNQTWLTNPSETDMYIAIC